MSNLQANLQPKSAKKEKVEEINNYDFVEFINKAKNGQIEKDTGVLKNTGRDQMPQKKDNSQLLISEQYHREDRGGQKALVNAREHFSHTQGGEISPINQNMSLTIDFDLLKRRE